MSIIVLKEMLDKKVEQYNRINFIENDPISIPHSFSKKEDIEISGFITASLAWGRRDTIIKNAKRLMQLMDNAPHDFVLNHTERDLAKLEGFVHRTFNFTDLITFLGSLQNIYRNHGGLESALKPGPLETNMKESLIRFNSLFFEIDHLPRTYKHVASPAKNSACKRLVMYLRWMARKDNCGVDFGIWNSVSPSQLSCPLDVHSGRAGRKIGLLHRKQDDWKAVEELDSSLRQLDNLDPAKYDFALFGMGVFENSNSAGQ